ncbi:MAG: RNA-binding protein [Candidatus Zixiibacteriota bacterium]
MNIYVGNLSSATSKMELRKKFGQFGVVGIISINKKNGNTKGYNYCFVEMPNDNEAFQAIKELNGKMIFAGPNDGYGILKQ